MEVSVPWIEIWKTMCMVCYELRKDYLEVSSLVRVMGLLNLRYIYGIVTCRLNTLMSGDFDL